MKNIRFVSYDGEYPNLCRGTLIISVDGVERKYQYVLESGGYVSFDEEWQEHIGKGNWKVIKHYFNDFSNEEIAELEKLINKHIPKGCCGGCI